MQHYDVIGDIHGQFDKLETLLKHMGYSQVNGVYQHPKNKAVFVGDIIDRGPEQIKCLELVRAMVDGGGAHMVMGNHEYNAICWVTPDPYNAGDFLRPHHGDKGQNNYRQHEAFLKVMEKDEMLYKDTIHWFKNLPLWLDLGVIRVVHACWSSYYMTQIKSQLTSEHKITDEFLVKSGQRGSLEYEATEVILKGPEVQLPNGLSYEDKDRHVRNRVRIKWWDQTATTYPELALLAAGDEYELPAQKVDIPAGIIIDDVGTPIFFGHYWMRGTPERQMPTMACVDYSAAKEGPLVAYRWQGEKLLRQEHFCYL